MAGNHPVHIHPVRSLLHHLERTVCLLGNPKLMTAGLLRSGHYIGIRLRY